MWSVQRMKCFVTPSAPVLTSLANRNLNLSLYPDPPKNEGLGTRLGGGSGHETKCTHILQVWTYSPDHLCYRQCGSRHFCDSSPSSWSPDRSHWVQAPSLPRQLDWQGSTLHGSTGGGPLLTLRTTSSLRQERWGWGGGEVYHYTGLTSRPHRRKKCMIFPLYCLLGLDRRLYSLPKQLLVCHLASEVIWVILQLTSFKGLSYLDSTMVLLFAKKILESVVPFLALQWLAMGCMCNGVAMVQWRWYGEDLYLSSQVGLWTSGRGIGNKGPWIIFT